MQPVAFNVGNCKIKLKYAGDFMAATKLKVNIQPTKPKINMDDFKELFAALFKIKDRSLQARIMKAINNMPEKCPNCAYNLLELKKCPEKCSSVSSANIPEPLIKVGSISINKKQIKSTISCSTQTISSDWELLKNQDTDKISQRNSIPQPTKMNQKAPVKNSRFRRARLPHVIKNTQTINNLNFTDSDDVKPFKVVSVNNNDSYCIKLPASTYLQLEVRFLILVNTYAFKWE